MPGPGSIERTNRPRVGAQDLGPDPMATPGRGEQTSHPPESANLRGARGAELIQGRTAEGTSGALAAPSLAHDLSESIGSLRSPELARPVGVPAVPLEPISAFKHLKDGTLTLRLPMREGEHVGDGFARQTIHEDTWAEARFRVVNGEIVFEETGIDIVDSAGNPRRLDGLLCFDAGKIRVEPNQDGTGRIIADVSLFPDPNITRTLTGANVLSRDPTVFLELLNRKSLLPPEIEEQIPKAVRRDPAAYLRLLKQKLGENRANMPERIDLLPGTEIGKRHGDTRTSRPDHGKPAATAGGGVPIVPELSTPPTAGALSYLDVESRSISINFTGTFNPGTYDLGSGSSVEILPGTRVSIKDASLQEVNLAADGNVGATTLRAEDGTTWSMSGGSVGLDVTMNLDRDRWGRRDPSRSSRSTVRIRPRRTEDSRDQLPAFEVRDFAVNAPGPDGSSFAADRIAMDRLGGQIPKIDFASGPDSRVSIFEYARAIGRIPDALDLGARATQEQAILAVVNDPATTAQLLIERAGVDPVAAQKIIEIRQQGRISHLGQLDGVENLVGAKRLHIDIPHLRLENIRSTIELEGTEGHRGALTLGGGQQEPILAGALATGRLDPAQAEDAAAREKALLAVLNDPATTRESLVAMGVDGVTAMQVMMFRAGADGRTGTSDDQTFTSLADVETIPGLAGSMDVTAGLHLEAGPSGASAFELRGQLAVGQARLYAEKGFGLLSGEALAWSAEALTLTGDGDFVIQQDPGQKGRLALDTSPGGKPWEVRLAGIEGHVGKNDASFAATVAGTDTRPTRGTLEVTSFDSRLGTLQARGDFEVAVERISYRAASGERIEIAAGSTGTLVVRDMGRGIQRDDNGNPLLVDGEPVLDPTAHFDGTLQLTVGGEVAFTAGDIETLRGAGVHFKTLPPRDGQPGGFTIEVDVTIDARGNISGDARIDMLATLVRTSVRPVQAAEMKIAVNELGVQTPDRLVPLSSTGTATISVPDASLAVLWGDDGRPLRDASGCQRLETGANMPGELRLPLATRPPAKLAATLTKLGVRIIDGAPPGGATLISPVRVNERGEVIQDSSPFALTGSLTSLQIDEVPEEKLPPDVVHADTAQPLPPRPTFTKTGVDPMTPLELGPELAAALEHPVDAQIPTVDMAVGIRPVIDHLKSTEMVAIRVPFSKLTEYGGDGMFDFALSTPADGEALIYLTVADGKITRGEVRLTQPLEAHIPIIPNLYTRRMIISVDNDDELTLNPDARWGPDSDWGPRNIVQEGIGMIAFDWLVGQSQPSADLREFYAALATKYPAIDTPIRIPHLSRGKARSSGHPPEATGEQLPTSNDAQPIDVDQLGVTILKARVGTFKLPLGGQETETTADDQFISFGPETQLTVQRLAGKISMSGIVDLSTIDSDAHALRLLSPDGHALELGNGKARVSLTVDETDTSRFSIALRDLDVEDLSTDIVAGANTTKLTVPRIKGGSIGLDRLSGSTDLTLDLPEGTRAVIESTGYGAADIETKNADGKTEMLRVAGGAKTLRASVVGSFHVEDGAFSGDLSSVELSATDLAVVTSDGQAGKLTANVENAAGTLKRDAAGRFSFDFRPSGSTPRARIDVPVFDIQLPDGTRARVGGAQMRALTVGHNDAGQMEIVTTGVTSKSISALAAISGADHMDGKPSHLQIRTGRLQDGRLAWLGDSLAVKGQLRQADATLTNLAQAWSQGHFRASEVTIRGDAEVELGTGGVRVAELGEGSLHATAVLEDSTGRQSTFAVTSPSPRIRVEVGNDGRLDGNIKVLEAGKSFRLGFRNTWLRGSVTRGWAEVGYAGAPLRFLDFNDGEVDIQGSFDLDPGGLVFRGKLLIDAEVENRKHGRQVDTEQRENDAGQEAANLADRAADALDQAGIDVGIDAINVAGKALMTIDVFINKGEAVVESATLIERGRFDASFSGKIQPPESP